MNKCTIDEAAEYLNVSTAYIYRLIHTAKLKCIGGYINKESLQKYQEYIDAIKFWKEKYKKIPDAITYKRKKSKK